MGGFQVGQGCRLPAPGLQLTIQVQLEGTTRRRAPREDQAFPADRRVDTLPSRQLVGFQFNSQTRIGCGGFDLCASMMQPAGETAESTQASMTGLGEGVQSR
ncbi:MAG: hypothetical protein ABSB32_05980 [Thermodesulfobacteriota bacterium]